MKSKTGKFKIVIGDENQKIDHWEEVKGKIVGVAGIHFDGFWWKITHIPTGRYAMVILGTEEKALLLADAVNYMLGDVHISNDDEEGMKKALSPYKDKSEKYMEYINGGGEKHFKEWDFIRTTEEKS